MVTEELDLSLARNRVRAFNSSAQSGAPVIELEDVHKHYKPKKDFTCYGGAKQMWQLVTSGEPQVMISGPV